MHENHIFLLFWVCSHVQMVHWIIINKTIHRFQIFALKGITIIIILNNLQNFQGLQGFSKSLNLHQNAKVNPPYGIVLCVHSLLSEQYINMKSQILRDPQVKCVTSFPAILIGVWFNVFWRTIMDYDFNPLAINSYFICNCCYQNSYVPIMYSLDLPVSFKTTCFIWH